ncbi:hypothetical protein G6F31_021501 [Rhizopus arrhizus]|nr:hypothetical protein G6F31_021501 [Rhizopus arrhizus]
MRYTEIRLAKIAHELLADIDQETVDFGPNYDGSAQEPLLLPSRLPNLLVNGNQVRNDNTAAAVFQARFKPLMALLLKLAAGAPTRHFIVDLKTNTLTDMTAEVSPF